jgi:pyridoxal phosphate enzyme (YggS family)
MAHHETENFRSVYLDLQTSIAKACESAKRSATEISLIAVTKTVPAARIADFVSTTNHRDLGENYAQELCEKAEALASIPIRWHYIGQLQSNKIARIVKVAASIQSVESIKHARFIHRYAAEFGKLPFPIYIAVNAGSEDQKGGISGNEALQLYKAIKSEFPELKVCGIMAIPPASFSDDGDLAMAVPELYSDLAQLARQIGDGKLSLGMSGDYKLAIKAGSQCLRIGSLIFGKRT